MIARTHSSLLSARIGRRLLGLGAAVFLALSPVILSSMIDTVTAQPTKTSFYDSSRTSTLTVAFYHDSRSSRIV